MSTLRVAAVRGGALILLTVFAAVFLACGGDDAGGASSEGSGTPSSTAAAGTSTAGGATPTAKINSIAIVNGRYAVDFSTFGLALDGIDAVVHVHFFFDTVPVAAAGVPGTGPWFVYGGGSPFTGYSVAERPAGANQMCVLVANLDHSIRPGTGNCFALP